jgi:hypothetical protein
LTSVVHTLRTSSATLLAAIQSLLITLFNRSAMSPFPI